MDNADAPTTMGHLYFDFQRALVLLENVEHRVQSRIHKNDDQGDAHKTLSISSMFDSCFLLDRRLEELESCFNDLAIAQTVISTIELDTSRKAESLLQILENADSPLAERFSQDIPQLERISKRETQEVTPSTLSEIVPSYLDGPATATSGYLQNISYQPADTPLHSCRPRNPRIPHLLLDKREPYSARRNRPSCSSSNQSILRYPRQQLSHLPSSGALDRIHHNVTGYNHSSTTHSALYNYNPTDSQRRSKISPESFAADELPLSNVVSAREFESVPNLLRSRVNVNDINDLYFFLLQLHSKRPTRKGIGKESQWITAKELMEKGVNVSGRKGEEKLLILRYLKRIELSKDHNNLRIIPHSNFNNVNGQLSSALPIYYVMQNPPSLPPRMSEKNVLSANQYLAGRRSTKPWISVPIPSAYFIPFPISALPQPQQYTPRNHAPSGSKHFSFPNSHNKIHYAENPHLTSIQPSPSALYLRPIPDHPSGLQATFLPIHQVTNTPSIPPSLAPLSFPPQTSLPQTSLPQTSLPQTSLPQTSLPQTSLPQTSLPQTSLPQTSLPYASFPSTSISSNNLPHISVPPSEFVSPSRILPLSDQYRAQPSFSQIALPQSLGDALPSHQSLDHIPDSSTSNSLMLPPPVIHPPVLHRVFKDDSSHLENPSTHHSFNYYKSLRGPKRQGDYRFVEKQTKGASTHLQSTYMIPLVFSSLPALPTQMPFIEPISNRASGHSS